MQITARDVARNLLRGRGDLGMEVPSGVQGQSSSGGLGAKSPEAGDTCTHVPPWLRHCPQLMRVKTHKLTPR